MEPIIQMGIMFALWLQSWGGWLEIPMKVFTFLGTEEFFLLGLPIVYWCLDAGLGLRMGVVLLSSSALNSVLKLAFFGPRPYWVNPQVKAMVSESSFGAPSGHAQIAASLWGVLAWRFKRAWGWVAALCLTLLIGLSRLYLGVHFLHDVLIGWLLGALVLWVLLRLWNPTAAWVQTKSTGQQIGLAFGLSVLILIAGALAFGAVRNIPLPPEWTLNAQAAGAQTLPDPLAFGSVITSAATLFGLLAGLAWIQPRGGFSVDGTLDRRALRFLVGLVGVIILWNGLGAIFPREEALLSYLLRYLRYALVGAWISAGAPWLFVRFKLAKPSHEPRHPK